METHHCIVHEWIVKWSSPEQVHIYLASVLLLVNVTHL